MHIGILQFELFVDHAQSLKDKRRVVRSVKDRLHREHQVSVAEVGSLDVWNRADMGLVGCSGDAGYLSGMLEAIVRKLEALPDARLGAFSMEIVGAKQVAGGDDAELWTEGERRDAGAGNAEPDGGGRS